MEYYSGICRRYFFSESSRGVSGCWTNSRAHRRESVRRNSVLGRYPRCVLAGPRGTYCRSWRSRSSLVIPSSSVGQTTHSRGRPAAWSAMPVRRADARKRDNQPRLREKNRPRDWAEEDRRGVIFFFSFREQDACEFYAPSILSGQI